MLANAGRGAFGLHYFAKLERQSTGDLGRYFALPMCFIDAAGHTDPSAHTKAKKLCTRSRNVARQFTVSDCLFTRVCKHRARDLQWAHRNVE